MKVPGETFPRSPSRSLVKGPAERSHRQRAKGGTASAESRGPALREPQTQIRFLNDKAKLVNLTPVCTQEAGQHS